MDDRELDMRLTKIQQGIDYILELLTEEEDDEEELKDGTKIKRKDEQEV